MEARSYQPINPDILSIGDRSEGGLRVHYNGIGLTKREYFAALALQGIVSDEHLCSIDPVANALRAVEHADALIAALNAK